MNLTVSPRDQGRLSLTTKIWRSQVSFYITSIEKNEEAKTKAKSTKGLVLTERGKKGLKVIRESNDSQRKNYSKILIKFIESKMKVVKTDNYLYNLDECDDPSMSQLICEQIYEIEQRKQPGKTLSLEVACGLLMQLFRTRKQENIKAEYLDEDNNNITSDEIRRMIQDKGCAEIYDLIYEHMLNVIEAKKSSIAFCSRYLSEALLNYNKATPQDKKYVENSISRSMKREIMKRNLNNSSNAQEMMNKQFSPNNSEDENVGVVMGMKKKNRNKGFELNVDDFGFDASDKQALEVEEDYIDDFESIDDF